MKNLDKNFKIDMIHRFPIIFLTEAKKRRYLKILMNKKIEIYARSIFLQGILLKNSKSLPRYFNRWRKKFNDFENWCDKNKILK